jgi:ankyrin repeat protein
MPQSVRRTLLIACMLSTAPVPSATAQQPPAPAPQETLWDAAMAGDTTAMAGALAHGASIDSLDVRHNPHGRRALNWSAWFDRGPAIEFLVRHGAGVNLANRTGFTPLHHAAEHGSAEAASTLLRLGADPELRNSRGERPVDVARMHRREGLVLLLEARSQP